MKKTALLILFVLGMTFIYGCSSDDPLEPDSSSRKTSDDSKKEVDTISWSTQTYKYPTFIWHHQAKGDTCVTTTEYESFYIGRNYGSGYYYVKQQKANTPI